MPLYFDCDSLNLHFVKVHVGVKALMYYQEI